MSRKITPEEIERLAEYNKTHKYCSIEAYQDTIDWMFSDPNSKDILEILRSIPEEYAEEVFTTLDKEITSEIDKEILKDLGNASKPMRLCTSFKKDFP